MTDPGYNSLLKWGVENSETSLKDPNAPKGETKFDPAALARIMGGLMGPSDAEMMRGSFEVLEYEEATHEEKVTAFRNFEMLIENLDNANNMEVLGLWTKLAAQLENPDAELRALAAWCCNVAIQNNVKTQERLLIIGAIPTLVKMATEDSEPSVRKKAVGALSSVARNFQPGLDAIIPHLPAKFKPQGPLDSNDMDSVDTIIQPLRENVTA